MSEEFSELVDNNLDVKSFSTGQMVEAKVVNIDLAKGLVTIDGGLKSESDLSIEQFKDDSGEVAVNVGEEVKVIVLNYENGRGVTQYSRKEAIKVIAWKELEESFNAKEVVTGIVQSTIKGGLSVNIKGLKAFLPGSLIDQKNISNMSELEGQSLEFKIIKMDKARNNIVVTRKFLNDASGLGSGDMDTEIVEGTVVKGMVKNLTDYGAFIDLGGLDGLLHITDISWMRVKHPSEVIKVGEELELKILKFDKDKNRVSLGMKQLQEDPWLSAVSDVVLGSKLKGKITNIADYGCFVDILNGIEGLVHITEMDWVNKNIHPSKLVKIGQEVDVMVLELDNERRRISLGIKQCTDNPWEVFDENYKKGDKVTGKIKTITDFGIFVGLDFGIDGLVHISDITWENNVEQVMKQYKKGDEVSAIITSIDPERERVSLSIKSSSENSSDYAKNSIVTGEVIEILERSAIVALEENVHATLDINEISFEKVDDINKVLKVGDSIEAKVIYVDKSNNIFISIKSKDAYNEKQVLKKVNKSAEMTKGTTLGDMFKDQLGNLSSSNEE